MPSYKLTYFNARGVAEPSRIILAYNGVEFEDVRVEREQWPAMKDSTKQGKLPMLNVDGKTIVQSSAICRYLARKFDMYGKNNHENTAIDEVMGSLEDIGPPFRQAMQEQDEGKKVELMKKVEDEVLPTFFKYMDTMLKDNGGNFFVGEKLSLADIVFFTAADGLAIIKFPDCLQPYPDLVKHKEKIAALPKIKAYLDKRPKTEF